MLTLPLLNRRHRAGVFLVLVTVGLSLFFEASAKQTVGIFLLGLAATWFFGSVSLRALALIASSVAFLSGISLAVLPLWKDWNSHRSSAQEYDSALAAIREAFGKSRASDQDETTVHLKDGTTLHLKGKNLSREQVSRRVAAFREWQAKQVTGPLLEQNPEHGPWEKYAELGKKQGTEKPSATRAYSPDVAIVDLTH
jgi:hypothetical protein